MHSTLTRRRLLQLGGVSALTMGVPGTVSARMKSGGGTRGDGKANGKSCIFILLCGGPSHVDTWDMKPEAPAEIRGPYKPIATKVPGMRINEMHTNLAKLTDKFALINSMTHPGNTSNHFDAMHKLLSGNSVAPADSPYLGSILAKQRPSEKSVASYVWLIKCVGDPVFCAPNLATGGSLGAPYAPMFVGDAKTNPATPDFQAPDTMRRNIPPERSADRQQLLTGIGRSTGTNQDWIDIQRRGFELADSDGPRKAFEIDREDPRTRDRYGRNPLGQNLLLARRLVESGVGFVTVNGWVGKSDADKFGGPPSSSWDMHGSNMGMGNAFGDGSYGMGFCLPRLDIALSALLTDLTDRGMLQDTLVVVTGEFGRTPKIIPGVNPGRQHWPQCYSSILAGGGIRGGAVYGSTDKTASSVRDKPVLAQDISATIFHCLGVPYEAKVTPQGLSKPLSTGTPLLDLFG